MLKERISADIIVATKNRDAATQTILKVLKSELERSGNQSDEAVVKEAKNMISNIKLSDNNLFEIQVLSNYVPKQLEKSEIEVIVLEQIKTNTYTNIGPIMNHFKVNYTGLYDGKMLSDIAKKLLT